jgi:nicotinate-nucleotide adenylyltransferase
MKIGIFGGTFNPVHYGHLRAAEEVREKAGFDKILFVPAKNPPLKSRDIAHSSHRYEMLRRALRRNRFFELSDIEFRLKGKSFTVRTIEALRKKDPGADFSFILGIDSFLDIPNWWQPERLVRCISFVIVSRPGFFFRELRQSPYLNVAPAIYGKLDRGEVESYDTKIGSEQDAALLRLMPIGISSTGIRELLMKGKSVKYLLPAEVKSYIISNKLYKA